MAWLKKEMLMTTGYSFDGYSITEYKQVIAGECVIGTGFLSDLSAVVNDFFGTTSNTLSRKLDEARAYTGLQIITNNAGRPRTPARPDAKASGLASKEERKE